MKNLIEQRAGLIVESRRILDTAAKENRALNSAETEAYEKMDADITALTKTIDATNRLSAVEASLTAQRDGKGYRPGVTGNKASNRRTAQPEYADAFANWFRRGSADYAALLETGSDPDGGFLLPETLERQIIELQYNLDPLRMLADVRTSRTLVDIPVQASGVVFAKIGENGTYPTVSPTLGKVTLVAHKMGGMIPASDEILLDADSDVEGFVLKVGGQAKTDLDAQENMVGNGSNGPLGLFNSTTVGGLTVADQTGSVSATATLTADDLLDTQHKLKAIRRARAVWVMHDATLKAARKLKAHDNQYIWQPGLQAGVPDRLLGAPVYVSDYAPQMAVATRSICYGDLKGFRIQDRLGMEVKRLNELYAASGQIAWRFTYRTDGRLVDPNSVVFFKHGAAS